MRIMHDISRFWSKRKVNKSDENDENDDDEQEGEENTLRWLRDQIIRKSVSRENEEDCRREADILDSNDFNVCYFFDLGSTFTFSFVEATFSLKSRGISRQSWGNPVLKWRWKVIVNEGECLLRVSLITDRLEGWLECEYCQRLFKKRIQRDSGILAVST